MSIKQREPKMTEETTGNGDELFDESSRLKSFQAMTADQ
jgi:hypothetical protein